MTWWTLSKIYLKSFDSEQKYFGPEQKIFWFGSKNIYIPNNIYIAFFLVELILCEVCVLCEQHLDNFILY